MPMSPAIDLNGGPMNYLYWQIESKDLKFTPDQCYIVLHNSMPQPVTDLSQWDWDG